MFNDVFHRYPEERLPAKAANRNSNKKKIIKTGTVQNLIGVLKKQEAEKKKKEEEKLRAAKLKEEAKQKAAERKRKIQEKNEEIKLRMEDYKRQKISILNNIKECKKRMRAKNVNKETLTEDLQRHEEDLNTVEAVLVQIKIEKLKNV